jgi:hypothetical protein
VSCTIFFLISRVNFMVSKCVFAALFLVECTITFCFQYSLHPGACHSRSPHKRSRLELGFRSNINNLHQVTLKTRSSTRLFFSKICMTNQHNEKLNEPDGWNEKQIRSVTMSWITKMVIGLDLCPFAKDAMPGEDSGYFLGS